jgi:uncharacterized membrane protein YedE/YeeE
MQFIKALAQLGGLLIAGVIAIAAFLLSIVIGILAFMAAMGAGIIALITFGILDYRKYKKPKNPDEYGD